MKNREIKFRGKRIDTGEWWFGSLVLSYNGTATIIGEKHGVKEVDPSTVGQYTGLKDKNGKEIYEGDIVKSVFVPLGSDKKAIEYYNEGVIVWNYNRFGVQLKIEGSIILDESRKLSHHRTHRETHKHPTAGQDWIDNNLTFNRLEIIGSIHDK